ncbi:MFS transporter [Robbsia sp. Bb-Pol-6]|uniref:MFS transporter n=1 Tax=Robbsia betulipollinis TaxID=2981849 RepID=A0ABT3ZJ82_9BURK|nr:MFS transporter [Robbsia betulipollinis]MCY0386593.1 MFS transporter [Robbsia betulipollinis]
MVSRELPNPSPPRPVPGRPAQFSTRIAFFVAGFGVSAWAPLVPFAKARAGLDDGALGLLLLCIGVGSILAMPVAGGLASRFGCRRVIGCAALAMCAMLPLLAVVAVLPLLAIALFLFGVALGCLDCTVNIQAVIVERASGKTMMSGFHGLYSLGGIVGAAGMTGLLSAGVPPPGAALCVSALAAIATVRAAAQALDYGSARSGPAFAMPRGIVLFIGVLCFIVFLTEGAMLDWSAVFLSSVRQVPSAYAGLGYVAFAATMTAGRLTGDAVVSRFGKHAVVAGGALLAAAGLALATTVPGWPATLAGYALVGAGCANIVPVMYSLCGRQTTMPENIAVPAISTLGYAGILAGPALIGFLAHGTSLSFALFGVAALLLGVAASARLLRI